MKTGLLKIIFFLISVVTFVFLSAPTAFASLIWENSTQPPQFCFQNFNAYGPLYASARTERTQGILGHLKARPKCDIIQLQEVWMEPHIDHIEESLKDHYSFSSPNRESRIGIMDLVMGDILSRETFTFTVNNSGSVLDRARSVVSVDKAFHVLRVKLPAIDEEFYVVNTHLHPSSQAVRLAQILDLLSWRLQNQNLKVILSGDFNSDPQDLERRLLMSVVGLKDAVADSFENGNYPEGFCTYCKSNPLSWLPSDHIFDYIFYSNAGAADTSLKISSAEVNLKGSPKKPLSDHYGIRAYFVVEEGRSSTELNPSQRKQALESLKKTIAVLDQEAGKQWQSYQKQARDLYADLERSGSDFEFFLKSSLQ